MSQDIGYKAARREQALFECRVFAVALLVVAAWFGFWFWGAFT